MDIGGKVIIAVEIQLKPIYCFWDEDSLPLAPAAFILCMRYSVSDKIEDFSYVILPQTSIGVQYMKIYTGNIHPVFFFKVHLGMLP